MLRDALDNYRCTFYHKSTKSNQSRQAEIKDKPQITDVSLFVKAMEYLTYVIRVFMIRIIEISVTYQPSSGIIGKHHHILKNLIGMNFPSAFFEEAEKSLKCESDI